MLVPATMSTPTPSSWRACSTPTWYAPLAPPPDNTRPSCGRSTSDMTQLAVDHFFHYRARDAPGARDPRHGQRQGYALQRRARGKRRGLHRHAVGQIGHSRLYVAFPWRRPARLRRHPDLKRTGRRFGADGGVYGQLMCGPVHNHLQELPALAGIGMRTAAILAQRAPTQLLEYSVTTRGGRERIEPP